MIPIPGYKDRYFISPDGTVMNSKGHVIKHIETPDGDAVELHSLGQRDRVLVKELIRRSFHETH